jgi:hypothetical protein
MRRFALPALLVTVFLLALCVFTEWGNLTTEEPRAQDQIYWSGYTWQVRPPGVGLPGPNRWSNSDDIVTVNDDGSLQLSVMKKDGKWISGEIANTRSLGYGTYRWEIATDLSTLDPWTVLGMFTYDQFKLTTHNEIDIESTRWGRPSAQNGSVSYWYTGSQYFRRLFTFTDQPPYQVQFIWRPGKISFYASDRTGKALIDATFNELIPEPSQEVATVNLWQFKHHPPKSEQSVRISKFTWQKLAEDK